jgi:DNA-binding GntR family transcriptional regulator
LALKDSRRNGGEGVKPAKVSKIDRRSLDWRTADALRDEILSGRLAPGQRLTETALATAFQVSRGTLRSALRALAHEGLIHQVAYTKWTVTDFSDMDAWELYTLRGVLEGMAAGLAAHRGDADCAIKITAAFERLVTAVASKKHLRVADADLDLHKTIVASTGHQRLIDHYRLLEQQVRHYIICSNALIMDLNQIVAEHKPIVAAIIKGDAAKAERLAREHNAPEVERAIASLVAKPEARKRKPRAKTNGRQPKAA